MSKNIALTYHIIAVSTFLLVTLMILYRFNQWDAITVVTLLLSVTLILAAQTVAFLLMGKYENENNPTKIHESVDLLINLDNSYRHQLSQISQELNKLQEHLAKSKNDVITEDIKHIIEDAIIKSNQAETKSSKLLNQIKELVKQ